jgi:hypothetical protein
MKLIRMIAGILLGLTCACAPGADGEIIKIQQSLINMANRGEIDRIEVLRIPDEVRAFARITPGDIEHQWNYRFQEQHVSSRRSELVGGAFRGVRIQTTAHEWDLRWGIIFYSKSGERIAAVYFDRGGRNGSLNQFPVTYPAGLLDRLKGIIRTSIE